MEDDKIEKIKEYILNRILFGSYARGTQNESRKDIRDRIKRGNSIYGK